GIEPFGVERAGAADDPVDLVALGQQQLGQVRAVLAGDAGDERALHDGSFACCCSYQAMVRRSPSASPTSALKPKRSRARVTSRRRRGWPLGSEGSQTKRPVNLVAPATRLARSRMDSSSPLPRLTGSLES